MATLYDETEGLVISGDDARSGETGHHVRYVLAAGLIGTIAALTGVALYFGYDRVHADLSAALSHSPYDLLRTIVPYAGMVLAGAIIGVLLHASWSRLAGASDDGSQEFMRLRIVVQFAAIFVMMAMLYFSTG